MISPCRASEAASPRPLGVQVWVQVQAWAPRGGAPTEEEEEEALWAALLMAAAVAAARVSAQTMLLCLDSAVVAVVVRCRYPDSVVAAGSVASQTVRMDHRCRRRQPRWWIAKGRVADSSKVTIGLIGAVVGTEEAGGVRVVVDMMAAGGQEGWEAVVGVARGGMAQAVYVGEAHVTEPSTFLLSHSQFNSFLSAHTLLKGNRVCIAASKKA